MNAAVIVGLIIILGIGLFVICSNLYAKDQPIPTGDMPATLSLKILDSNGQPINAYVMIFNMSGAAGGPHQMIYSCGLYASPNFQTLNYTFLGDTMNIRIDVENPSNMNQAGTATTSLQWGIDNKVTITLSP